MVHEAMSPREDGPQTDAEWQQLEELLDRRGRRTNPLASAFWIALCIFVGALVLVECRA